MEGSQLEAEVPNGYGPRGANITFAAGRPVDQETKKYIVCHGSLHQDYSRSAKNHLTT